MLLPLMAGSRFPVLHALFATLLTPNLLSFVYVLAANATTVDVISLDSPGIAERLTALNIAGPTKAAGITISA